MDRADYEVPVAQALRRLLATGFGVVRNDLDLTTLLDVVAGTADRLLEDMTLKQPPPQPLACAKGCAHCCHVWNEVNLGPLEALVLAAHLKAMLSPGDLADLRVRLREISKAKREAAKADTKPQFPCPLLRAGACSAYRYRPFVCRGYTSFDAERCENRTTNVVGYVHTQKIAQLCIDVLRQAALDKGLAAAKLDLVPALDIALSEPGLAARWLAGEDVFKATVSRR